MKISGKLKIIGGHLECYSNNDFKYVIELAKRKFDSHYTWRQKHK